MEIKVRNVSEALPVARDLVLKYGAKKDSRNGPVVSLDEPFTLTYERPAERVIFYPDREANPFFHLYECAWMLKGRRDVASVAEFVPGMRNYSDDGKIFNGAYGHRWRTFFQIDQITAVIERLSSTHALTDRRTYMTMWAPKNDNKPSLDIPCNVGIAWRVRSDGKLDMTVFNRSNDLIWGTTGANAVHMSFLHEFVASCCSLPLGRYHQVSNDTHIYLDKLTPEIEAIQYDPDKDPYARGDVVPYPIITEQKETWEEDLDLWFSHGLVVGIRERFFTRVLGPMVLAHRHFKTNTGDDKYEGALDIIDQVQATDWSMAAREWIERRRDRWLEKSR